MQLIARLCKKGHLNAVGPACKECAAMHRRCYQAHNAKEKRAYARAWARGKDNSEYQRNLRMRWRASALEHLGNVCARCGFADVRALQIDHVNGDGYKERKKYGAGKRLESPVKFYRDVIHDAVRRYQLLCANCNWIKRYENNEYRVSRHAKP